MAFVPDEDKTQTIRKDFIHLYGDGILRREGSIEAFQSWIKDHDPFVSESPAVEQSGKTCSIVFPGAENPAVVDRYLRHLSAEQLPPDYELLFFDDCSPKTSGGYIDSFQAQTKNISVIFDLNFDHFCTEIARQAEGKYVLYVNRPVSKAQVFQAVNRLRETSMNAAMDEERNFIIVKRQPFLKAGCFALM
jgi:hypothetical protein